MNLNWSPKKLTLVIIPDANQSVVRFRISNVYAIIALACMLLLGAGSMYILHVHALKAESAKQWNAAISSKNKAIEQLQNEVIELSQQTEQMKAKLNEVKELEKAFKKMAQPTAAASPPQPPGIAEAAGISHGVGGIPHPVSDKDIIRLSKQTKAALSNLNLQIDKMHESILQSKSKAEANIRQRRSTPRLWPTTSNVITSNFGYRKDPFTYRPSFHSGIDLGARKGEPVFATADGTVIRTGSDRSRGNHIQLEHAGGLRTWYMHLSKIQVKTGDTVSQGDIIGLVGSTGRSTGPHLHYEVVKNGKSIDPRPYLQTQRKDEQ